MSLKVMNWVWDYSPTKGTELLLLLAIADNASDDGTDAYPSVQTLARKTRLDQRTVQRIIGRLAESGQVTVSRHGGRKSNRYTVLMSGELSTPPANRHPRQNATGDTDATPAVAQLYHPSPGAAVPPEPPGTVLEPSTSEDGGGADADSRIEVVLARLGPAWPLTPTQRRRLAPKLVEALAAGWSAQRLAAHLGANPEGVKSPVAVLSSRLNDLPPVEASRPGTVARPEWCGNCDEPSRRIRDEDERWAVCPKCHPNRKPQEDHTSGRVKPPSTSRPKASTPTSQQTGRSDSSVSRSAEPPGARHVARGGHRIRGDHV